MRMGLGNGYRLGFADSQPVNQTPPSRAPEISDHETIPLVPQNLTHRTSTARDGGFTTN